MLGWAIIWLLLGFVIISTALNSSHTSWKSLRDSLWKTEDVPSPPWRGCLTQCVTESVMVSWLWERRGACRHVASPQSAWCVSLWPLSSPAPVFYHTVASAPPALLFLHHVSSPLTSGDLVSSVSPSVSMLTPCPTSTHRLKPVPRFQPFTPAYPSLLLPPPLPRPPPLLGRSWWQLLSHSAAHQQQGAAIPPSSRRQKKNSPCPLQSRCVTVLCGLLITTCATV